MSPKQVHWKLPLDEYAACDLPKSRVSPLPSPPSTPASSPPRPTPVLLERPLATTLETDPFLVASTIPHGWRTSPLPSPPSTPPSSPPPPPFLHDRPLPTTLEIHPLLTPPHALHLDFSFPSDVFRQNPHLTDTLLAAPACTPSQTTLSLRISAGAFKQSRGVAHEPHGEPVTVGDVLTTVQQVLRAYDHGAAPPAAAPYMRRRIETVNDYFTAAAGYSAPERAAKTAAERAGQGRVVDSLLGYTLFGGFTVEPDKPDNCWQLHLTVPERYMYL
ncbi:hypothetical protein C8R43DRAFT_296790 [Mycena crocata]|nr:hypothetical protein C8R43DRAFT_296790 [Mycena crocata]